MALIDNEPIFGHKKNPKPRRLRALLVVVASVKAYRAGAVRVSGGSGRRLGQPNKNEICNALSTRNSAHDFVLLRKTT